MDNTRSISFIGEKTYKFLDVVKLFAFVAASFIYIRNCSGEIWSGLLNNNKKLLGFCFCIFLLCFLFWVIFLIFNSIKSKLKTIESFIFIGFLSIFLMTSDIRVEEYKFLLLFMILISTLQFGISYGIFLASSSSLIMIFIDCIFVMNHNLNVDFEGDIIVCSIYFAVSWIIGLYTEKWKKSLEIKDKQLSSLNGYITVQKSKIIEMEAHINKLESRLDKNTELLSSIVHDLKTPLNVIFSALQVIHSIENGTREHISEKRRKYAVIMKNNCCRLMKMIDRLLDITRIHSGSIKLNLHNQNIVPLIEDMVDSVVPYAEDKGIDIVFDTDTEEKIMAVDIDKIERSVLNLLSNSIKFTKSGGRISVDLKDEGEYICISIKDNGIGIPKDKLDTIFQKFAQVDEIYRGNCEGSGIGLYLVKSFVELHGGKVLIESDYGCGSKFIIKLPCHIMHERGPNINSCESGISSQKVDVEFSDIRV